eukprot:gene6192-10199_t
MYIKILMLVLLIAQSLAVKSSENLKITLRKSAERGYRNHGWLKARFTFSFADYYNPRYSQFGCLRVINEDDIEPGNGFPTHPHKEFNIFTYMTAGALTHRDSMSNEEVVYPGDIQFTCAGTGIMHSEYNWSDKVGHHLQIWLKPNKSDLVPYYKTMHFTKEQKIGKLCLIVSQSGKEGSILSHSNAEVFASILKKGQKVSYFLRPGRKAHVHLIMRQGASIIVNDEILYGGDAVFITHQSTQGVTLNFMGNSHSKVENEFLFFDIKDE